MIFSVLGGGKLDSTSTTTLVRVRLVATAIVQAQSAHTAPGKIVALWLPIMTFVALGLEHR